MTVTPELQLAIACCRVPGADTTDAALADALAKPIDWHAFYTLLQRHRVVSLANFNLSLGDHAIPADMRKTLSIAARRLATIDLLQAAETIRLQRLFDAAKLPALFLKGATTGLLAFGRLGVKQSWDIDLLTTEASMMDALELLERDGYRLIHPAGLSRKAISRFARFHHEAQLHNDQGIFLELHWHLFNKPILAEVTALSDAQLVQLGGGEVRTLRDDVLIAYLIGHGQEHGWGRLKWLADLNALLARRSDTQWERLIAETQMLGVGQKTFAALLLCERLFGLRLPPGVAAQCRQDRSAANLVAVSLDCIVHPQGGSELPILSRTNLALIASRLRREEGWRSIRGEIGAAWTQPRARARYPAHLDWLYHILRIPMFLLRLPLKLGGLRGAETTDGAKYPG